MNEWIELNEFTKTKTTAAATSERMKSRINQINPIFKFLFSFFAIFGSTCRVGMKMNKF